MGSLNNLSRLVAGGIGALWCMIEPTAPFLLLCIFSMCGDVLTAWLLNRRIRATYGPKVADGKLKSRHMEKIISDMCVLFCVILLAYHVDNVLLPQLGNLHLAQYVSAIYCLIQITSMLENQSSCNDARWAKILQQFLADKTERHLNVKLNPDNPDKNDNDNNPDSPETPDNSE